MWLRLIIEVVLLALSAVSLVSILRALSPIQKLVKAKKKPWSCDACLGFWTTLVLAVVVVVVPAVMGEARVEPLIYLAILPAHGLTLIVLSKLRAPEFPFELESSATPTQDTGSWHVGGALEGEKP